MAVRASLVHPPAPCRIARWVEALFPSVCTPAGAPWMLSVSLIDGGCQQGTYCMRLLTDKAWRGVIVTGS